MKYIQYTPSLSTIEEDKVLGKYYPDLPHQTKLKINRRNRMQRRQVNHSVSVNMDQFDFLEKNDDRRRGIRKVNRNWIPLIAVLGITLFYILIVIFCWAI